MGALGIGDDTRRGRLRRRRRHHRWPAGRHAAHARSRRRRARRRAHRMGGRRRPVDRDRARPRTPPPATFTATPWPADRLATADDAAALAAGGGSVIDARARRAVHRRAVALIDPRPGHIPGARSAPWSSVLGADGRFRSPDDLRAHFAALGVADGRHAIAYCGSGVSACMNILAMEHAGLTPPRLYVASWSGWSADPDRRRPSSAPPMRHAPVADVAVEEHASTGLDALKRAAPHPPAASPGQPRLVRGRLPRLPVRHLRRRRRAVDQQLHQGRSRRARRAGRRARAHGPAVLGLFVAFAFMAGIRGGAQGGPVALEAADVAHVMLAPVDRRRALMRPAMQRLRSAIFAGAMAGAIVGQLAGRRLPGSLIAWAGGRRAVRRHSRRPSGSAPRCWRTRCACRAGSPPLLGTVTLAWQAAAVAWHMPGPATLAGSLGLWGWRQHPVDLVAVAVTVIGVVVGLRAARAAVTGCARPASALVAQLRFAVTMQDLRTVILLRRQLNQEHPRRRPYVRLRSAKGGSGFTATVWRRGWHGLLRFPVSAAGAHGGDRRGHGRAAGGRGARHHAGVRGHRVARVRARAGSDGTAVAGGRPGRPRRRVAGGTRRADGSPSGRPRRRPPAASRSSPVSRRSSHSAGTPTPCCRSPSSPCPPCSAPPWAAWSASFATRPTRRAPSTQQAFIPPEMAGFTTAIRLAVAHRRQRTHHGHRVAAPCSVARRRLGGLRHRFAARSACSCCWCSAPTG